MSKPIDQEREAFETHSRKNFDFLDLDERGDYENPFVQSAWEGWQARAAVQPAGWAVPDGWKLVPERMSLDSSAIEAIQAHCGDGQEEIGFGPYHDGVLWVGECEDDDGSKTYGLHIATADYPEEGSTTLANFAAPHPVSGEQKPAAYLHQVVQGDGEPDEALSFEPDSFPLSEALGFRSIACEALYKAPPAAQNVAGEKK